MRAPRPAALDYILDDLDRKHLGYYICPMGMNSRALKTALEAARKAGVVALKGFRGGSASRKAGETSPLRGGFKVEYKSDSSPVTACDRASEKIIRQTLARAFPGDGFIGEEYGETRGTTGADWIIDPIDGTKNFIRGIPFWGSLIARAVGGKLVLGVMHLPALGETLWAVRGKGSFHNGKRIRVSRVNRLSKAFLTHGGLEYFVRDGDAPRLEKLAAASYIARSFGDCGAYAYVARGMTDAMLERGLKPWDAAAPKIIVEEAGGKFTDWSGRDDWRSPEVLATNGLIHSAMLKLLKH